MRTILHTTAFSFKNIVCNDVRNTSVLHSALKTGLGIVLFFLVSLMPETLLGQVPDLKTASDFVLFTGNGDLGNTGVSEIYGGAIGTDFGTITGFGNVNCVQYIEDDVTAQCLLDLQEAFDSIHNIPITQTITAANLSGDTLAAGVYLINSAVTLTIDLTLDAEDNPDALFIFNVTGAFNAAAAVNIILLNGATVNNIFWNVDAAIGFGAGTSMKGTFLSLAGAITIGANSFLEGRALTISGDITMDNDILVKCLLPAVPTTSLTQPTCSVATGTITITAPTGTGMTYSIDGSDFTNTSGIFTQVPGGIYTVTAKDPGGCMSWKNDTIKSFVHAPELGAVLDFLLFTSSGAITNTGLSSVLTGGAVGTNAGTITGFGSVVQHIQDSTTAQCALDLQEAFNEIHNIPITQTITAASLYGGTFTAGVYYINTAVAMPAASSLTLDAENNPDAIFIFNVTGAFGAAAAVDIILLNGASVNNIFWNVDAAVSIAAGANMKGTFLSLAGAIDFGDGASLEGRALTIAGNVNITNSPIEVCIRPAAPTVTVSQPSSPETTGTITVTEPTGTGMMYRIDYCTFTNTTGIFTTVPPGTYPVAAINSNGCVSSITYVTIVLPVLLTWNGSTSTSWVTATNWTPQVTPSAEAVLTIPDAATTTYDPSIPDTAICGKMIIESGGILNSVVDGQLTVMGANGAWINNGTFAPGTGTIIFANGDETETVTISGTSNFYNLTVSNNTRLLPDSNSVINIAGEFTADNSSCILDFGANPNTVGYNGNNAQSVVNPGGIYGYYHLTFSGNGTKVLSVSSLKILGNLNIDAVVSTAGNTLLMAGTIAQNIGGGTAATLNNLTIDNAIGVTLTNTATTTISGSLLINSGKIFEIAAAQKLTVTGSITNSTGNGGFILNSDATGTASIIHNSDSIAATVKRYISGDVEDWHFLSSPVFNQSISGDWLPVGTYGNGTGYDLYVWDEPTPCWVYQLNTTVVPNWPTVHPSNDFVSGRGYLYSVQTGNPTKTFAGNLNNGDQTIPIAYSSPVDSIKGFNLVGNPYPSSIDWKATSGWTRTNLLASGTGYDMWIWNPTANNYGVFNSDGVLGSGTNDVTQYIAPMQGFFVRAASSGSMGLTNAVRVHDEASNWKSAIVLDKIKIRIESNAGYGYDEVLLQFGSFVNQPGTAKLFSPDKSAPSLFIPYERELLSVIYLTNTEDNSFLPLTFKPGGNGEYTFSVDYNMNNFETFILEDKESRVFYDLKENNSYRFAASTKNNINRFVLHFEPIKDENEELTARIYSSGNKVYLDFTLVDEYVEVKVVDVLGRSILQKTLNGNTIHSLQVNTTSQIIIVFAKTKNAFIVRKVFVE